MINFLYVRLYNYDTDNDMTQTFVDIMTHDVVKTMASQFKILIYNG